MSLASKDCGAGDWVDNGVGQAVPQKWIGGLLEAWKGDLLAHDKLGVARWSYPC